MRVEEFLDRWLPTVRGTVRPSTFKRHEEVVRLHIRPSLGGLKLLALEPAYVTGFVEGCLERIGEDDAEGPDLRRAGWEEGDRDFVPDNPKVEVEVRTGRPPAGP